MSKHAGGRPAKSGARRELKTFRLVPEAIARLERVASERGGSTSDVLNEVLLSHREPAESPRSRRLELVPPVSQGREAEEAAGAISRFRVLPGGSRPGDDRAARVAHDLEKLRDALGGVLGEIEDLMAEQNSEAAEAARPATKRSLVARGEYADGFRAGMLEALETAYCLLQSELVMSEGFAPRG